MKHSDIEIGKQYRSWARDKKLQDLQVKVIATRVRKPGRTRRDHVLCEITKHGKCGQRVYLHHTQVYSL